MTATREAALRAAFISIASVCLAWWVAQLPWIDRLDESTRGLAPSILAGKPDFSGVLIADLAQPAPGTDAAGGKLAPYSREFFGQVAAYLLRHRARAVALDLLFQDAQPGDESFGRSLNERTVLAAAPLPFYSQPAELPRQDLTPHAVTVNGKPQDLGLRWSWPKVGLPQSTIAMPGHALVGLDFFSPDEDGLVRRAPLLHGAAGLLMPSFPLAVIMAASGTNGPVSVGPGRVMAAGHSWPVAPGTDILLNFPQRLPELPSVPFDRLAMAAAGSREDPALNDMIRDRIVIIGNSSEAAGYVARTPAGPLSGVQLNALAAAQLDRNAVEKPDQPWQSIMLALVAACAGFTFAVRPRRGGELAVAFVGVVAVVAAGTLAAGLAHIGLRWTSSLLAGLIAIVLTSGIRRVQLSEQRRVRRYEKQARAESNRLKTEFLNHLTHELRTPLTAIMGFNKINQYTDELGKDQRIANSAIIARNCEHLLTLINNNLDLAKLEAGELAIARAALEPDQIFRDVVATMRALAVGKTLQLKYTQSTPLPDKLMLDGSRLRQVLINLMGNALKFTSEGSVELGVAWHLAALTIEVRDTGTGIAPESLQRIWQPFRQADLTVAGRFGGTGLGLAISRKMVELMGGEISVESRLGAGTTFRVRLPSSLPDHADIRHAAAPPIVAHDTMVGRILLADDNEDLRNLVRLLLRNLGLSVHAVENGLLVVEQALTDDVDVILMDMEMPVMDGYEAAQVLRTRGYAGTIFGLTAHAEGPETARAILAGCDAVLHKPISIDTLKAALTPALARRRAQPRTESSDLAAPHG
jgi:signal transduction histidine kinase/CheY-like chemotaxis protein